MAGSVVGATFAATDATSGVATTEYSIDGGSTWLPATEAGVSFAEVGAHTVEYRSIDLAGNVEAAKQLVLTVQDVTPPAIGWVDGPADGATYPFDSVPPAPRCTATDAIDPAATCVVAGYDARVGSHILTATANDRYGNTATSTRRYTVAPWKTGGFYAPVDGNGVWNTVKGGATVPLKFELFAGDNELTSTNAVSSFKPGVVTCGGLDEPTDEIELTTTGGTGLRFDASAGQFVQNWQTPKSPGTCFRVAMTAKDGSTISALFKLR